MIKPIAHIPDETSSHVTPERHDATDCWDGSQRSARMAMCELFLLEFVRARLPSSIRRHVGASDIVQSVLLTISQRVSTFRGQSDGEFRQWILQIARRKLLDGIRRYRPRNVPQDLLARISDLPLASRLEEETPSANLSLEEDVTLLLQTLTELPGELRHIVVARYVRNATFEDISSELALPVTTVRRRWLEAIQMLGSRLGPLLR